MERVTKNQFANNAVWKFLEVICSKLVSLVISTILARLLVPEAYGVVALTTVFITFSDIFILNGFNVALIRKEKVEDIDYSTVTVLGLIFSSVLYVIFFFTAPLLASFYKTPELEPVLRVITILLFFQSIATVIRAKGTRELRFKEMSVVSILGATSASVIGVFFAYKGFGVWALVVQLVLTNFFDMILLIIVFRWKISFKFSPGTAKQMLSFTVGVLGASFLDFLGNNTNSLVIGKTYNTTDLGYYNRGNMYPETISLNTYNSINSVLLPTLASSQDDTVAMKHIVRRVVSITQYIIFPMMFGLAAISDKFVSVLLTDKWIPCIGIMISACVCYSVNPIRAIGYNVFYAKGESKRSVRIEIFRSFFMIANLLITIIVLKRSIYTLVVISAVIAVLVAIATQFQVRQCIGYRFRELFADLMPSFLMSCAVVLVARAVCLLSLPDAVILILQMAAGAAVYIGLSIVTGNKNISFLWGYVKQKVPGLKKVEKINE